MYECLYKIHKLISVLSNNSVRYFEFKDSKNKSSKSLIDSQQCPHSLIYLKKIMSKERSSNILKRVSQAFSKDMQKRVIFV